MFFPSVFIPEIGNHRHKEAKRLFVESFPKDHGQSNGEAVVAESADNYIVGEERRPGSFCDSGQQANANSIAVGNLSIVFKKVSALVGDRRTKPVSSTLPFEPGVKGRIVIPGLHYQ